MKTLAWIAVLLIAAAGGAYFSAPSFSHKVKFTLLKFNVLDQPDIEGPIHSTGNNLLLLNGALPSVTGVENMQKILESLEETERELNKVRKTTEQAYAGLKVTKPGSSGLIPSAIEVSSSASIAQAQGELEEFIGYLKKNGKIKKTFFALTLNPKADSKNIVSSLMRSRSAEEIANHPFHFHGGAEFGPLPTQPVWDLSTVDQWKRTILDGFEATGKIDTARKEIIAAHLKDLNLEQLTLSGVPVVRVSLGKISMFQIYITFLGNSSLIFSTDPETMTQLLGKILDEQVMLFKSGSSERKPSPEAMISIRINTKELSTLSPSLSLFTLGALEGLQDISLSLTIDDSIQLSGKGRFDNEKDAQARLRLLTQWKGKFFRSTDVEGKWLSEQIKLQVFGTRLEMNVFLTIREFLEHIAAKKNLELDKLKAEVARLMEISNYQIQTGARKVDFQFFHASQFPRVSDPAQVLRQAPTSGLKNMDEMILVNDSGEPVKSGLLVVKAVCPEGSRIAVSVQTKAPLSPKFSKAPTDPKGPFPSSQWVISEGKDETIALQFAETVIKDRFTLALHTVTEIPGNNPAQEAVLALMNAPGMKSPCQLPFAPFLLVVRSEDGGSKKYRGRSAFESGRKR